MKDKGWLVTINSDVVDLSSIITWHPGGAHILTSNRDCDVTDLFNAFHLNVSYRHLIVTQTMHGAKRNEQMTYLGEFRELNRFFKVQGWYDPPMYYFSARIFIYFWIFLASFYCMSHSNDNAAAIAMGMFWQQSAGLGHDLGHSSSLATRCANRSIGSALSVVTGISSVWWRHSHFQHHVHTNVKEEDPDIILVPVFLISEKLHQPFYHNFMGTNISVDRVASLLVGIQHLTLYPVLLFARLNLYWQSIKYVIYKRDFYAKV